MNFGLTTLVGDFEGTLVGIFGVGLADGRDVVGPIVGYHYDSRDEKIYGKLCRITESGRRCPKIRLKLLTMSVGGFEGLVDGVFDPTWGGEPSKNTPSTFLKFSARSQPPSTAPVPHGCEKRQKY